MLLTCQPAPICTVNFVQSTSTDPWASRNFSYMYEVINSEPQISHGMANPLLESFEESPNACMINSSRRPANFKGKENPELPSVCSNYWPPNMALSLCLQIPQRSAKPIASIHHTVQYP